MSVTFRTARVLLLIGLTLAFVSRSEGEVTGSVSLNISATRTSAPVGAFILLNVRIANIGEEVVVVPMYAANFELEVESAKSKEHILLPRYTTEEPTSSRCVPLLPHSVYEWQLPLPLNDHSATSENAWIPLPGSYQLAVIYSAAGSANRCDSAFDGLIRSQTLPMTIRPPSRTRMNKMRGIARRCAAASTCDDMEVANFYSVVRDAWVVDDLIRLLETSPPSVWLLRAIVRQGRRTDSERLREIERTVGDTAVRELYREAIARLSPEL